MPALRKSLSSITAEDLRGLIDNEWAEDELLEFKQTLSTADGTPDRWMKDQQGIGERAKRDLFVEIVGFANSYGGDLVLGMDETASKPPRAAKLVLLPKCVELAHRLELAARDLIKPPIPTLAIRGVPIDAESGSGVVVARVPRSRGAPHRLEMRGMEKECYRRVRDRTEAMSMREIQDLTIAMRQGIEGIAERLDTQSRSFHRWAKSRTLADGTARIALRVSATPSTAELTVNRVHSISEVTPSNKIWPLIIGADRKKKAQLFTEFFNWRPILRGTECRNEGNEERFIAQLFCDGTVNYFASRDAIFEQGQTPRTFDHAFIHPAIITAALLGVLDTAERFRNYAGAQATEYALDVEVEVSHATPLLYWREDRPDSAGVFTAGSHRFPPYSLQEPDSWNDLLTLALRDLFDTVGAATGLGQVQIDQ